MSKTPQVLQRLTGWKVSILKTEIPAAANSCTSQMTSKEDAVGGEKNIGFYGGVMLMVNSITGPGLLIVPLLFQQAGYVTPLLTMFLIGGVSWLSAVMLCAAMERVPGNQQFKGRVEFTGVAKAFFPHWLYIITVFLLMASIISSFIPAVVVSAQTADEAIIQLFGKTFAFRFSSLGLTQADHLPESGSSPFDDEYVFSIGYLLALAATIPMGLFNLDDNIIVQKGAAVMLLLIFIEWMVCCFVLGFHSALVSAFTSDQSNVLGSIIFNFAFITTVPSWCNEKAPGVSVKKTMTVSVVTATVFYAVIGLLGGFSLTFNPGSNLLIAIEESTVNIRPLYYVSCVCVYLFPLVAVLTTLAVYSIIMKYNLVENGICNRNWATFWAVVFPWVISILLYPGSGFLDVINWTSLCINGVVNFVIPLCLYIASRRSKFTRQTHTIHTEEGMTHDESHEKSCEFVTHVQVTSETEEEQPPFDVFPPNRYVKGTHLAMVTIIIVTLVSIAVVINNIVLSIQGML
ncbi:hypothetical protein PROFUN_09170 [Planoprotostelium fungivorum]|uniref:Amino acid transporter transmembrane domain-containing protein n=1 Tax=Planoprotostelium fungivorum TaxID=1890364 RepID=A0A2P6MVS3_9EUKA|nr:hypothetical protein PROFUN_09170 [Planoprotostelium fungivorum]